MSLRRRAFRNTNIINIHIEKGTVSEINMEVC